MEVLIVFAFVLFIYLLPTVIASSRRHRQTGAIGVLNLLLGWTVLGWIGALVWACTSDVDDPYYRCQFCAEQVSPKAVVCKHCGKDSPLAKMPTRHR